MQKNQRMKESNILQIWGNKDSMNMNSMILTNIQSSMYFKKDLYEKKTYHEVIDEIYYRVKHLEPWEKGSRKTQGLTGMCGGVRGVGGGGIVSTAFCILYKLYTLKLTRKQVMGLLNHQDSVYIRGLGFMYIRYTQAPADLWDWFVDYLDDEEEIDVKAGGGYIMTIGGMLKQWLTRLEWFETLFPRIPIPIQQDISFRLRELYGANASNFMSHAGGGDENGDYEENNNNNNSNQKRSPPPEILDAVRHHKKATHRRSHSRSRDRHSRSRSRSRGSASDENDEKRERKRSSSSQHKHHKSHKKHRHHNSEDDEKKEKSSSSSSGRKKHKSRSKSREHKRSHHRKHHSSDDEKHRSHSKSEHHHKKKKRDSS